MAATPANYSPRLMASVYLVMLSSTAPLWNNLFPKFLNFVASKSFDQNFLTKSQTKMSI